MSFTASAVTPQSEEPKHLRRPKEPYESTVHHLSHNNVNTSVHKALFSYLAEDKSLFTSTGLTLFFSVGRLSVSNLPFAFGTDSNDLEELAPFQVESKLCEYGSFSVLTLTVPLILVYADMDQFMFDKRNGVRLGLDSDSVKNRLTKIENLEKQRKAIGWHQGGDSRALLRASIKYFETLCSEKGADAMRLESVKEAAPRLTSMLAVLEKQITEVEHEIGVEKKAVEDERKATMSGFLNGLSDPLLQTVCLEYEYEGRE